MSPIAPLIKGSQKLTTVFGDWPSFHDAEIVRLQLWRGDVTTNRNSHVFPILTVELHMWELTRETDAKGFLVTRRRTAVTMRFEGIEEDFKLDGFNHQNAIFELTISQSSRVDGPSPYFEVQFVSSFGMSASFKCCQIEVMDAAPFFD